MAWLLQAINTAANRWQVLMNKRDIVALLRGTLIDDKGELQYYECCYSIWGSALFWWLSDLGLFLVRALART